LPPQPSILAVAGIGSAQTGGGGNAIGWVFLNVDDLNESLVDAEFNKLPGGMLTWGGYGLIGLGDSKWSIGGTGGGGEAISEPTDEEESKIATLALNYGGIMVEYGIVSTPKTHVGLGAVLGGGMALLTTKRGHDLRVWRSSRCGKLSRGLAAIPIGSTPRLPSSFLYHRSLTSRSQEAIPSSTARPGGWMG